MTQSGRRKAAVVGLVVVGAVLTGCDSERGDPADRAECGSGTSHGCFDLSSYGNLYCAVQQTRGWLDDGSLEPSDLPSATEGGWPAA